MSKEVKPTPSGTAILTVRMPASMIGELRREAATRGVPVSTLVREAIMWKRAVMLPQQSVGTLQANPGNTYYVVTPIEH